MADIDFTLDEEDVAGLFLHKDTAIAKMLSKILNQLLEFEVDEHLQAKPYERSIQRKDYRNGFRHRGLATRTGVLDLLVPRVRNNSFNTELFERYQRSEQALIMAMIEMVINGVSTRKVDKVVHELCGANVSKSQVSVLCNKLDPIVDEWRTRRLDAHTYPFLLVDALVVKSRGQ